MTCIAVVDFGKTNVKLGLVDAASLREIAARRIPNVTRSGPPYPHYDTEAHWQFLIDALTTLGQSHAITAISITTHGATAALVDAAGALVMPILDYEHDGPETMMEEYKTLRPAFAETGSPLLACGLTLGAQLYWQFQTFPEAQATHHILTYPQYWACRLSGIAAVEPTSLGCHTDLWNPWEGRFSSLVQDMGWERLMPAVRAPTDILGPLLPEIAAKTGLDAAIPVICGIHDSNASLYPHLASREGAFSVVSTGTWVVCMAVGGAEVTLDPARDTLVNVNGYGAPVPSARFMGGREYEMIRTLEAEPTAADKRAVIARDVMLLPAVEPGSGPFRGCKAEWTSEAATPGERNVALSYYLALMTATCLGMIGAEGSVIVEGPFAANADYLRMLATATGKTVEVQTGNVTGTSVGAAMLVADIGKPSGSTAKTVTPDPELAAYAASWQTRAVV